MLLDLLKSKAIQKGILNPDDEIDLEKAFTLVRDMPYTRASSRVPETIIEEWRGTCSGKHYLLKGLFAELGYSSRLIACTTEVNLNPKDFFGKARRLLKQSNGRFVDVHNYLILELPEGGEMIVDATWPIFTKGMGTVVNEEFVLGQGQKTAAIPIKNWEVPDDRDAQALKGEILKESFTPDEIVHREEFIAEISRLTNSKWVRILAWLQKLFRNDPRDPEQGTT